MQESKKNINLVILESPAKATTVNSYLGSGYKVIASKGHVKDLPKSTLGVDTENGFKVKYINIQGKSALIAELKKEAKNADKVYFATDPDREGEAISWHLATVLGIAPEDAYRVSFNEITKKTVQAEIQNPKPINMDLVNAQQARRILDRIVGYKLSPYLWKTVKSGLSAGRVQSVATRIIVEREAEIEKFVPKEFWTIEAILSAGKNSKVKAKFYGDASGKIELSTGEEAQKIVNACKESDFKVVSVKRSKKSRSPEPPFETSTLQQVASKRFGFHSKRTMKVAQELYEGIDLGAANGGVHGIITYMRTDSLRISDEAANAAESYIREKYGADFYPNKRKVYKTKGAAQDAHEAIRPASMDLVPENIKPFLSSDQYRLYKLIWDRFVASQMKNAEYDAVEVDLDSAGYRYKLSESVLMFKGYKVAYTDDDETADKSSKLKNIAENAVLSAEDVIPTQNFTEPPAHFDEASLIKFLKEKGIGRPSTYATTISTIIDRGYIERDKKLLLSTPLGVATVDLMKKNFPDIVDYKFTASMESQLDEIARGENTLETVLTDFYGDFEKTLAKAQEKIGENKVELPVEESDIICDKCGKRMIIKSGRFGKFAACPGYPECKNTKPLDASGNAKAEKEEPEKTDLKCELCGGDIVIRKSRYGKFYACSNFPKCKYTKPIREEIGVSCPKCGAPVVKGFGKNHTVFFSCSEYPKCDFSVWDMPTNKSCPVCGERLLVKKGKGHLYCMNKECSYKEDAPETAETKA
ncbi:MAG: type I DNA topoisomerase [Clostridia bacterium]|nr:type I DNA topoisomerase [Clostridia bacterium]